MAPALKTGDRVKLEPVSPAELQIGQVVVVSMGGQIHCHRLIRRFIREGQEWAVTKGDGVAGEDPPVPAGQIIGVVAACARPRVLHRLAWRAWGWGSRRLQAWRLGMAAQMFHLARGLEFLSFGVLRPDELIDFNRRFYSAPDHVSYLAGQWMEGFYPPESALMDRFAPKVGTALVLGCGAGREAIALAKRGWKVVGLDGAASLIDAAKENADRAGLSADWICLDLAQGFSLGRSFDLICLFGQLYSLIPTRRLRIRLLADCRKHLQPHGCCLLNFIPGASPSRRAFRAQRWRRRLAWVVRGNRECELGDVWGGGPLFTHRFSSWEEMAEEAAAAGLDLELHGESVRKDMVVLTPARAPLDVGLRGAPSGKRESQPAGRSG
jgi:SAM-dependent methyltransferase